MKKNKDIADILDELGKLYDFNRELLNCNFKKFDEKEVYEYQVKEKEESYIDKQG